MKKLLFTVSVMLFQVLAYAQINFGVQADGSFKDLTTGKSYVVIDCPGQAQSELYYNFLVTLQNKCIVSNGQYDVVENKCINIYAYESEFDITNIWLASFSGYLYYKLMFQFQDGRVRIEAPIVDHLGNYNKTNSYWKFTYMLLQTGMFNTDGTIKEKRRDQVEKLNADINHVLTDIVTTALRNNNW